MSDKLKPCPFCGGEARLIGHSPYSITCCKCRATTVICNTPDDAIDAWNRRAEPTFTPDELEEIFHRLIGHYPEMSDAGCSAFEKVTHWRNRQ